MKVLTYGNLKIELDLDAVQEEVLVYEIKRIVKACRVDTLLQRDNDTEGPHFDETGSKRIITPGRKKNSKKKVKK